MNATPTELPGVLVLEPGLFADSRGAFFESYNRRQLAGLGIAQEFVQDNQSLSRAGVLRGLHYQRLRPQAKLIRVLRGAIYDVAVDLRPGSPTFGRWVGVELSAENRRMLYVPAGFGHGFCAHRGEAEVLYKCDGYYDPSDEAGVVWDDPGLGIDWPIQSPLLSLRDAALPRLAHALLPTAAG